MKPALKSVTLCILLASAGYMVVWLPWLLAGSHKNMIDGMRLESMLLLALLGAVSGRMFALRSFVIALSAVAAFPILAIIDVILDPRAGTHHLLGLEIVAYSFSAIPVFIGVLVSRRLFKWRSRDGDAQT